MSEIYILALATIFVILVVLIFKSLKQAHIFGGPATLVLTICVALLAILSLARFHDVGLSTTVKPVHRVSFELDFIMIHYAAMAITMLVILLGWLFLRLFGRNNKPWQSEPHNRPIDHTDKWPSFSDRIDKPSSTTSNKIQQDDQHNRVERKK